MRTNKIQPNQLTFRLLGPRASGFKYRIEKYENHKWLEVAATDGTKTDARRLLKEIAKENANAVAEDS